MAQLQRWPDGLQAAVEAKEGLEASADRRGARPDHRPGPGRGATRTLCGMTGTAVAVARAAARVLQAQGRRGPANEPCIREDEPDRIYRSVGGEGTGDRRARRGDPRHGAAGADGHAGRRRVRAAGRGAARGRAWTCAVLNARNDAEEAAIIAGAGERDARHGLHADGGPRHRHPARRGRGRARRPARRRLRTAHHRPPRRPAARARGAPGRPRRLGADLRERRGRRRRWRTCPTRPSSTPIRRTAASGIPPPRSCWATPSASPRAPSSRSAAPPGATAASSTPSATPCCATARSSSAPTGRSGSCGRLAGAVRGDRGEGRRGGARAGGARDRARPPRPGVVGPPRRARRGARGHPPARAGPREPARRVPQDRGRDVRPVLRHRVRTCGGDAGRRRRHRQRRGALGPRRPTSTWTYLVTDDPFGSEADRFLTGVRSAIRRRRG